MRKLIAEGGGRRTEVGDFAGTRCKGGRKGKEPVV